MSKRHSAFPLIYTRNKFESSWIESCFRACSFQFFFTVNGCTVNHSSMRYENGVRVSSFVSSKPCLTKNKWKWRFQSLIIIFKFCKDEPCWHEHKMLNFLCLFTTCYKFSAFSGWKKMLHSIKDMVKHIQDPDPLTSAYIKNFTWIVLV